MYQKHSPRLKKSAPQGFTVVELTVVVAISLLMVGVIVSFMLGVTDQFAVSAVRGQMNVQMTNATNRLDNDMRYSRFILAENSVTDSAAPSNDDRWNSGNNQLVLGATARNSANEPLSTDYTTSLDNYIYYLNSDTLYRRVLAFSDSNNRYTTSTCAQTLNGGCASDTAILRNIDSLEFSYYDSSGTETSDYSQVVAVKADINLKTNQSRQEIELGGSTSYRLAMSSVPRIPAPEPTSLNCFLTDNGGTRIRDYYNYENNITSNPACPRDVVIPPVITSIYTYAFDSKNLTSVVFINNGQSIDIGGYAFRGNNITSLNIPASVGSIGDWSFDNNQISSLTFDTRPSPIAIGTYAFRDNNLASLNIPAAVGSISTYAFDNNQINTLTFGARPSPIDINGWVFRNNNLTSLNIPAEVGNINSYAFTNNQISTLTFSPRSSSMTIGSYAFRYNNISSVTTPVQVTSIGGYAFRDNNSLTQATLSNSTTIQSTTFPSSTTITRY